jgi:hypothetical protein
MKIKITESQFNEYFKEAFDESELCPCGEVITEALTTTDKNDIKTIVKNEIKSFLEITRSGDLDKKIEDIVKKKIKSDKDIEKYMVEVIKNVTVQLYKTMWTRRNFWTSELKNSAN